MASETTTSGRKKILVMGSLKTIGNLDVIAFFIHHVGAHFS